MIVPVALGEVTVIVNAVLAPAASPPDTVTEQLASPPATRLVQLIVLPVPLVAVIEVSPAGSRSNTVNVDGLAAPPLLVTVNVYANDVDGLTVATAVLAKVKLAAATTVVDALLQLLLGAQLLPGAGGVLPPPASTEA